LENSYGGNASPLRMAIETHSETTPRSETDARAAAEDAASRVLASVLETAVDAIITVDARGLIRSFNRAAERMFDYAAGEVLGKNVSLLMPELHHSKHDSYLSNYLKTGKASIIGIGREEVGRRKDGSVFPIELSVSEVSRGEDRVFTGLIRDLSLRNQLEAEILEVSEREQQRIGHELHDGLCQELAGIAFVVQSLQQRAVASGSIDPSELSRVTRMLQDTVRHARGLSRGLYPVEPQPDGLAVALAQLAANTTDFFKVRCQFHNPRPVLVRDATHATHLYRIAQEAVREAIRQGKASRIMIELTCRAESCLLCVSDDGIDLDVDGRYREDMVLRMMRHRAKVIGGSLTIGQRHGGGVKLTCKIPHSP
jgi:two-component system CheB/CheR fusion protein